jgi:hypothetical protein
MDSKTSVVMNARGECFLSMTCTVTIFFFFSWWPKCMVCSCTFSIAKHAEYRSRGHDSPCLATSLAGDTYCDGGDGLA